MQQNNIHVVPPRVNFEPEAETMPEAAEYKPPRMRTIKAAIAELKKIDSETALTERALRRLVVSGEFPAVSVGNKWLVNIDNLFIYLSAGIYAEPPKVQKHELQTGILQGVKPAPGIRPVAI